MASFLRPTALKLRNFKGIAELDLSLDESLTLLAGVNGAGKTSVLQALLAAVTKAWGAKPPHNYPQFQFSGARRSRRDDRREILLELGVPDQSPIPLRLEVQERQLNLDDPAQFQGWNGYWEKSPAVTSSGRVLRTESRPCL